MRFFLVTGAAEGLWSVDRRRQPKVREWPRVCYIYTSVWRVQFKFAPIKLFPTAREATAHVLSNIPDILGVLYRMRKYIHGVVERMNLLAE